MSDFEKVGDVGDFPVGTIHKVSVNNVDRVLYSVDPATDGVDADCPFYVSQLHCWHRHPDNQTNPDRWCELSGTGVLEGKVVNCDIRYKPTCAHKSEFDVVTGERLRGPAPTNKPLIVYETKCENGEVLVSVEPMDTNGGD